MIVYECDRCHNQTKDEKEFTAIEYTQWFYGKPAKVTYHYCDFCWHIMSNAVCITNNGTYGGSLNPNHKIGKYVPNREEYDPMVKSDKNVTEKTQD